jgi:hypothetical protein
MNPERLKEHQWLHRFVGQWTCEAQCVMGPGQDPMKFTSTEVVRAIGGIWIQGESTSQMPDGSPATMLLTLGFDPAKKRFVGTWLGSMMTHLWIYDGELHGNVLTLNAQGPMCSPDGAPSGKLGNFKDVFEFKSDDHRILSSSKQEDDGQWTSFMTAHYHRLK